MKKWVILFILMSTSSASFADISDNFGRKSCADYLESKEEEKSFIVAWGFGYLTAMSAAYKKFYSIKDLKDFDFFITTTESWCKKNKSQPYVYSINYFLVPFLALSNTNNSSPIESNSETKPSFDALYKKVDLGMTDKKVKSILGFPDKRNAVSTTNGPLECWEWSNSGSQQKITFMNKSVVKIGECFSFLR